MSVQAHQKMLEDLRDKLVKLNEEAQSIQALADSEKRALTEEEEKMVTSIFDAFKETEKEIERREMLLAQEQKLTAPQPRIAQPADLTPARPVAEPSPEPRRPARSIVEDSIGRGSWGWRSFGEFAAAVRMAGRGKVDPRLVANAPTSYGSEANADGGYAIPPDFREAIMVKVAGEDSLLGRTDRQTTSSNQITVPTDSTTPWQASGGVLATWEAEAAQIGQSKPLLGQMTVRAFKLAALVPMTDELLEDAGSMANYLRMKVPQKFDYKINEALITGDGAGKPTGLLNSGSKVTQDHESKQAASELLFNNIVKMWSRLYSRCRPNAVWLVNQDIEQLLQTLSFPGTGTAVPVYLPPGGLSGAAYGTLLGRPVIPTEACSAIGTEGDIILTDLSTYLSVMKTGGLRQDVSIHLWFDYDMTAFRFILRIGGQSWWAAPITRANSSNTHSNIVTLQTRDGN